MKTIQFASELGDSLEIRICLECLEFLTFVCYRSGQKFPIRLFIDVNSFIYFEYQFIRIDSKKFSLTEYWVKENGLSRLWRDRQWFQAVYSLFWSSEYENQNQRHFEASLKGILRPKDILRHHHNRETGQPVFQTLTLIRYYREKSR